MFIKKDQNGQIMIESIIAITVGVVALTGVLNLLTSSIGINKDVGQRFTATYLAIEGIEVTKSIISRNYSQGNAWNQGLSPGGYEFEFDTIDPASVRFSSDNTSRSSEIIYFNPTNGVYSYDNSGNRTQFTRTVQIDEYDRGGDAGIDEIKAVSIVEWQENGNQREIKLEDHFFDWRPSN